MQAVQEWYYQQLLTAGGRPDAAPIQEAASATLAGAAEAAAAAVAAVAAAVASPTDGAQSTG